MNERLSREQLEGASKDPQAFSGNFRNARGARSIRKVADTALALMNELEAVKRERDVLRKALKSLNPEPWYPDEGQF